MWLQFLFSSLWEKRIFPFCKTPWREEFFLFWNFYLYKGIQLRILHTVIEDKGSVFNYSNPKFYISSQISSIRSYSSLEFTFVKNTSLVPLILTSSTKLQILNFETWMSSKSHENTYSFVLTSFQLTCNKNRAPSSQLLRTQNPNFRVSLYLDPFIESTSPSLKIWFPGPNLKPRRPGLPFLNNTITSMYTLPS